MAILARFVAVLQLAGVNVGDRLCARLLRDFDRFVHNRWMRRQRRSKGGGSGGSGVGGSRHVYTHRNHSYRVPNVVPR